jgi:hypothetical protein
MGMRFTPAQRAENPDLVQALMVQQQQTNALKAQEANERASNMQGGVDLAVAAPDGTFTNAWDTATGNMTPANGNVLSPTQIDPMSGAQSSGLMEGAPVDALGMGGPAPQMSAVANPTTGAGAEAVLAGSTPEAVMAGSEVAAGAEAAATAAEAATLAETATVGSGGLTGALSSMGPMGWGALALLAASQF